MQAKIFAVMLSFIFMSLPLHAATEAIPASPAVSQDSSLNKINLNAAEASTLSGAVKGIGKKRSEAIVKYREEHGSFKSIEDLAQVPGLGRQFVKSHLAELEKNFSIN